MRDEFLTVEKRSPAVQVKKDMHQNKNLSRIAGVLTTLWILALIAYGGYVVLTNSPLGLFLDQNPGPFDRERFEAIVQEVRALKVKPGEEKELRLDDLSDPKSLRVLKSDEEFYKFRLGRRAGNVWATMTPERKLKVVIETRDLRHAGEYGFAYSEAVLSPEPFGESWFRLDVPGRLKQVEPKRQIDDHWWEVKNGLD
jgi:hypothetical protein